MKTTVLRTGTIGAFLLGLMLVGSAIAQEAPPSDGPWFGLWKTNPEKTAAANGMPAPTGPQPARYFRMVQVGKDAFYYTIESVPPGSDKPVVTAAFLGRFDGKDYMEIGNPGADTNRFRIVDERTYELVDTKDGKDLLSFRISISEDGQTRTSVMSGTNLQGEKVRPMTFVSDRVE